MTERCGRQGAGLSVLLLGGTGDARVIAERLATLDGVAVVHALAGATAHASHLPGTTRVGGFGGVDGLVAYLDATACSLVIDATHPFADRISRHAVIATERFGCPLIRLERAPWQPTGDDRWVQVDQLSELHPRLPEGARAFLALGKGALAHAEALAAARADVHIVLRTAEPIADRATNALPTNLAVIAARPPHMHPHERACFRQLGITDLVVKNAGGAAGRAKLDVARELGLRVWAQRPPELMSLGLNGVSVATHDEVIARVTAHALAS
ncbi:MAG: precorrin-6A/cobalt-precorrin-6A reductase [Pseudomonadota bacterium]